MDWVVSSVGTSGIVSFMTFKESPYDTPPSVAHFDQIGVRGHIILLEGIKTGTAKVTILCSTFICYVICLKDVLQICTFV